MVSIQSLQRYYDQLKEVRDETTEAKVVILSLERAVGMSIPAISNFYAASKNIADKFSQATQQSQQEAIAQAPKLKSELNSILHETYKKLRVAKSAIIDSMTAAKMPCTLLENLFLSEIPEYKKMCEEVVLLLESTKQCADAVKLRNDSRRDALEILRSIGLAMETKNKLRKKIRSKKVIAAVLKTDTTTRLPPKPVVG
jgi:hypothetical protein